MGLPLDRRDQSRLHRRTLIASGVAAATFAGTRAALAGPFDVADATWEGGSELFGIAKAELGPERVRPVASLDWSQVKPGDGILILHPTDDVDPSEASEFMKLGGRVGVLDDFGKGDELLRRFRIERVPFPGKPLVALRNNTSLPIAEPFLEAGKAAGSPHPVVQNVTKLVLNHPTALIHPDLSPVLKVRLAGGGDAIVAVAGQVGKGRLFAMSDPSAVINSMLRYPGNRAFAAGLVRYLTSNEENKSSRLYIVSNKFGEEGSVGGDRSLAQDIEDFLSSLLSALSDARRGGLPGWMLATISGLVVALLGFWVGRASGRVYKSPTPRYARPVPLVARGGVAGRFALLAAPTSPRSLVLLEWKSAAFEALAERFGLPADAGSIGVLAAMRSSGLVSAGLYAEFEQALALMQRTEAAVLAGGQARVTRAALASAADVTRKVLEACGVGTHVPMRAPTPPIHEEPFPQ